MRCDLPAHHSANLPHHLQLTFLAYQSSQQRVSTLEQSNVTLQEKYDTLDGRVTQLTDLMATLTTNAGEGATRRELATVGRVGLLGGREDLRHHSGSSNCSGYSSAANSTVQGVNTDRQLRDLEARVLSSERLVSTDITHLIY